MLADRVTVIRREQFIDEHGRVQFSKTPIPRVVGTVTMAGSDDLDRVPDYQKMGRVISFVSKFKMQGPALTGRSQFQPDYIVWRGDTYVVSVLDPYPQFGSGFTQALAGSIDSVDQSPNFTGLGGAWQFNFPRNSSYVPLIANI